jgi:hypothetical protein
MANIYFPYIGLTKFFPLIWLLSKVMGGPYSIKNAPIPCPKASHSTKNVFIKFGVARMGVVQIESLSF